MGGSVTSIDWEAWNADASVWMKRGIALLNEGTAPQLNEAVQCFDRAIAMRAALPLELNPLYRHGLAAGWMNRGDALTRLGSLDNIIDSIRSFDEALAHCRQLPLDQNPAFRRRYVIAWLNRGIALQKQPSGVDAAAESFAQAIALLEPEAARAIPDRSHLLGCAWVNRATALTGAQGKLDAARRALDHLKPIERDDLIAAEAGMKARHILCQSFARMAELETENIWERLCEATDAVDDGLSLARHWNRRDQSSLLEPASELFTFGAIIYQRYQPHFLVEFILDHLDPKKSEGFFTTEKMIEAASTALQQLFRQVQSEAYKNVGKPEFEQTRLRLAELTIAENSLLQTKIENLFRK